MNEKSTQQPATPDHQDAPDDVEGERIVRKSTRTSVIVRQAERDAIRAALQATMKVSYSLLMVYLFFHHESCLIRFSFLGS
jgi:hypothetical protein